METLTLDELIELTQHVDHWEYEGDNAKVHETGTFTGKVRSDEAIISLRVTHGAILYENRQVGEEWKLNASHEGKLENHELGTCNYDTYFALGPDISRRRELKPGADAIQKVYDRLLSTHRQHIQDEHEQALSAARKLLEPPPYRGDLKDFVR